MKKAITILFCLMFCPLTYATGEDVLVIVKQLQSRVETLESRLEEKDTEIAELKKQMVKSEANSGTKELVVKDEKGQEVVLPAYMTPPEDKEDTGFFLEAGLRYINPRGTDVDVGIPDLNKNNSPEGMARGTNYDLFPTGLYRVGYRFKDNSTISASFWNLSAFETINLSVPSGGQIWITPPIAGNLADAVIDRRLNGSLKLNLNQYDVDYTRPILRTQKFDLGGLVGIRYVNLNNNLSTSGEGTTAWGTLDLNTNTQMVGGKMGFLTEYKFFKGLSLFSNFTLSMLVGNTDNTMLKVREPANPNIERNTRARNESVYPILEEDIGLKYWIRHGLAVKAGYHFGYWGDVITQQRAFDDVNRGYTLDHSQAVTLDGATFSLEYTF